METNVNNTVDTTGAETRNSGEKTFTQAELDAIIADRLDRQKKALTAQQQKQKDDADAAKLKEQEEYKTLAEQLSKQVADLEPLQSKAERYEAVIKARLEHERKGLPKPIVALLDKMDAVDQLEWIETNKAEVMKPAALDINAGNRGASASKQDRVEAEKRRLDATGHYISL